MNQFTINVKAGDGANIPVVFHTNEPGGGQCKGAVIIVHGFGEHSGSYSELIARLTQAGHTCVIYNQRGHGDQVFPGQTNRRDMRGVTPGYQSFLDDLGAVAATVKHQLPNTAITLYGHSMGGNIALNYLLKNGESEFSCALIESPWLGLYVEINPFVAGVASVLGKISPNIAIMNKLSYDDITGDNAKTDDFRNDPLYHNRISLRMFSGINDGCRYAIDNAPRLSIPTFFAYASNDKIVSNRAIRKFLAACGQNVAIKEYQSNHAIHNDVQREELYKDIIAFLNANH